MHDVEDLDLNLLQARFGYVIQILLVSGHFSFFCEFAEINKVIPILLVYFLIAHFLVLLFQESFSLLENFKITQLHWHWRHRPTTNWRHDTNLLDGSRTVLFIDQRFSHSLLLLMATSLIELTMRIIGLPRVLLDRPLHYRRISWALLCFAFLVDLCQLLTLLTLMLLQDLFRDLGQIEVCASFLQAEVICLLLGFEAFVVEIWQVDFKFGDVVLWGQISFEFTDIGFYQWVWSDLSTFLQILWRAHWSCELCKLRFFRKLLSGISTWPFCWCIRFFTRAWLGLPLLFRILWWRLSMILGAQPLLSLLIWRSAVAEWVLRAGGSTQYRLQFALCFLRICFLALLADFLWFFHSSLSYI